MISEMPNKSKKDANKDSKDFKNKITRFFEQQTYLNYGKIRMRVYPWRPKEYYTGSDLVMEPANKEVKSCSQVL